MRRGGRYDALREPLSPAMATLEGALAIGGTS